MRTKEQVVALWTDVAQKYCAENKITSNVLAGGWTQVHAGNIAAFAICKLLGLDLNKLGKERFAELCCLGLVVGNSQQEGQRLFKAKDQKATAIANNCFDMASKIMS